MNISINDLLKPIHAEMITFERVFEESLKSHVFLINQVMKYMVAHKGKKMRPMLLVLAAKLGGECTDQTYTSASLIEVLHTATLIHDDVVDEAETRRGLPSINSIWRNKISILIGDYLFSKALINMVNLENPEALKLLSHTANRLVTGEIDQIDRAKSDTMTEEAYYNMIDDKTASLVASACQLGIMSTSDDPKAWAALNAFGKNFGIAFQIKDDLFDFEGRAATVGKPVGLDVKHNMVTLPLIYTFNQMNKKEAQKLKRSWRKMDDKKAQKEVLDTIKSSGGLDYTKQMLENFSQKAVESLNMFEDSSVKDSLTQFVAFNIQRQK
jgi:octaprenyl-diphosphate synthase